MRIQIEDIKTRLQVGGPDFLVDFKLMDRFREYMSVKVPGAFFAAKKLKFHWDGMRYFLTPKGVMATGFLPTFLKYLDEEYPDLDVIIEDHRENIPVFKEEFQATIGSITINDKYIHEKECIQAYNNMIHFRGQDIYFPRGIINAATNAGKTAIMAGVYLNLQTTERMLIVIHSKLVFKQLVEYMTGIFGEVGQINDKYRIVKPVTIAMIQTLYKHIDESEIKNILGSFTVLAVDESQRAGSSLYSKVLVHCPASIRMFVSGTAFDSDNIINKMVVVGLSGMELKKVSKRYLMDNGISTEVKVHMHLCNTILNVPTVSYDECINALIHTSKERVAIMGQIIQNRMSVGPIMIAVEETQHGMFIMDGLSNLNYSIELTHSTDSQLADKVEAFKLGGIDVLITTGVLREGINLPLIHTIINAAGKKSKNYIKQWMGRGERLHESKSEMEFHDFFDIGKYAKSDSERRIRCYKEEGLDIIYHYDQKVAKKLLPFVVRY